MWLRFNSLVLAAAVAAASGATPAAVPHRATSVVRVDGRTGRLVRAVVVAPRQVPERVVAPVQVSSPARATAAGLERRGLREIVKDTAQRHDVDPLLVDSVIQVESGYNALAVSPKGAEGLMQLIPSTARRFGVRNTFDAQENIEGGVRYLKYLKELFKDDRLVLAAYNAGEAAVARFGWIPPYPETQNYVYQVGKRYGEARRTVSQEQSKDRPMSPPAVPEHPPIEQFIDPEGRLHLRTK